MIRWKINKTTLLHKCCDGYKSIELTSAVCHVIESKYKIYYVNEMYGWFHRKIWVHNTTNCLEPLRIYQSEKKTLHGIRVLVIVGQHVCLFCLIKKGPGVVIMAWVHRHINLAAKHNTWQLTSLGIDMIVTSLTFCQKNLGLQLKFWKSS